MSSPLKADFMPDIIIGWVTLAENCDTAVANSSCMSCQK